MYRSCIFCSADLGSNETIEQFPVGRSLAFDGARGRLWAVCPRCARWNLAPIDERGEAIETGERLFRDSTLRAQSENVGLAKLRDGTRLVRVGAAQPGELAFWRYGDSLVRRRRRYLAVAVPVAVVGGAGFLAMQFGPASAGMVGMGGYVAAHAVHAVWSLMRRTTVLLRLSPGDTPFGEAMLVNPEHLEGARLVEAEGGGIGVRLPELRHRHEWSRTQGARVIPVPVTVGGDAARRLLNRAMVVVNEQGAPRDLVADAVGCMSKAGSPDAYLAEMARAGHVLRARDFLGGNPPVAQLALEMALHEETERRALEGELAALEEMWRQAEEIASIADRLPDVPAPEPPRTG